MNEISKATEYLAKLFGPKALGLNSDIGQVFVSELIQSMSSLHWYVFAISLFIGCVSLMWQFGEMRNQNSQIGLGKKTLIGIGMLTGVVSMIPGNTGSIIADMYIRASYYGSRIADDVFRMSAQLITQPVASTGGGATSTLRDSARIRLNGHVRTRICRDQLFRDGFAIEPVGFKEKLETVCGFSTADTNSFINRMNSSGQVLAANDRRWKQFRPGDALIYAKAETPESVEALCLAQAGEKIIDGYAQSYDASGKTVKLSESTAYAPIFFNNKLGSDYATFIGGLVTVVGIGDKESQVITIPTSTKITAGFNTTYEIGSLLAAPKYTPGSVSECFFNARSADYLEAAESQAEPYRKAYIAGWLGAGSVSDTFASDISRMQDRYAIALEEKPANAAALVGSSNDAVLKTVANVLTQALSRYDTLVGSKTTGKSYDDMTNLGSSTINTGAAVGSYVTSFANYFKSGAASLAKSVGLSGTAKFINEEFNVRGIARKTFGAAIQTCATGESLNSYYNTAAKWIPGLPEEQCDIFKPGEKLHDFKNTALLGSILIQYGYLLVPFAIAVVAMRWLTATAMYALLCPIFFTLMPTEFGRSMFGRYLAKMIMTIFMPVLIVFAMIVGSLIAEMMTQMLFELMLPQLSFDTLMRADSGIWDYASWIAGILHAGMTGEIIVRLVIFAAGYIALQTFLALSIIQLPEWIINHFGVSDPHAGLSNSVDASANRLANKFDNAI